MISLKKKGYDDADIAIVNMILVIEKCSIADIFQTLNCACASAMRRISKLQEKGVIILNSVNRDCVTSGCCI